MMFGLLKVGWGVVECRHILELRTKNSEGIKYYVKGRFGRMSSQSYRLKAKKKYL